MDNLKFRNIIISHYQNPKCKGFINNSNAIKIRHNSEYCIDDLTIEILWKDNIVKNARFEGVACTVATAAIDIFCLDILYNNKKEVKAKLDSYEDMLLTSKPKIVTSLNNLGLFGLVANQPNRVQCALIPVNIIRKTL